MQRLVGGGQITHERGRADRATSARRDPRAGPRRGAQRRLPPDARRDAGGLEGVQVGGPDASAPEVVDGRAARGAPRRCSTRLTHVARGLPREPEGAQASSSSATSERREHGSRSIWGTGRDLAFATLLARGQAHPPQRPGRAARHVQPSSRGALRQRDRRAVHAARRTSARAPRGAVSRCGTARCREAGVLGFEYGYSLDTPDGLVIWEAQFGDFANAGAGDRRPVHRARPRTSGCASPGLVLLLPHGYEGQGPGALERAHRALSQLAAEDNIQVCNLTTPAQFFHVLRRQVLRPLAQAARRLHAEEPPAAPARDLARSTSSRPGAFQRVIPDAARRPGEGG